MTTDYVNDPGNRGITIYDQEGLNERFARAHAAGFQLAAHAIGDRAITMILDAYEHALTKTPKVDHRFRIEHCGMCTPEIIDRMVRMQIIAVPQPSFIYELGRLLHPQLHPGAAGLLLSRAHLVRPRHRRRRLLRRAGRRLRRAGQPPLGGHPG